MQIQEVVMPHQWKPITVLVQHVVQTLASTVSKVLYTLETVALYLIIAGLIPS